MIPFMHYLSEARKIKSLDRRYGTARDPRLNIHSEKAYKESGSGTGIWRAGIGHNPKMLGVKQERPVMTASEQEQAGKANRSREMAKRKKGRTRSELQNRFDPFTAITPVPEIGKKLGLSKSRTDAILKGALEKIKKGLGADFDPSKYSSKFTGEYSRPTKRK